MSVLYTNPRIVEISPLKNREGIESYELFIETDCEFHLDQRITIPNDPTVFDKIDIPAYDGRSVADWIRSL